MTYDTMNETRRSLILGIPHPLANLANAAALLWEGLDRLNWAGFYLTVPGKDLLVLGPFQGKTACIEIPYGRGVCGTAAAEQLTQVVSDVHLFPGHIACDSASASEIVIPLRRGKGGPVVGVLDLDSPEKNRFGEEDRQGLETFAAILGESLPDDFPARLL